MNLRAFWSLSFAASVFVGVTVPAGAAAAPPAGQVRHAGGPDAIAGSYIVVLKPQLAATSQTVAAKANELTNLHNGRIGHVYSAGLQGFAVDLTERSARRLAAHPAVDYVQQDQRVQLNSGSQQYPPSWGLDRIDQPGPNLDDYYAYPNDGAGVSIYVIDTGIRLTHQEFIGRVRSGIDVIDGGTADDCLGHGTHVAGTAGGYSYGVAKEATLVAVRVFDCNELGTLAGIIAAVDWVTADHDPGERAVANMSLGGPPNSALEAAVRASIADGVVYVASAGNAARDACGQAPARITEVITVGSTDSTDSRAATSNYGTCVDLFAPGHNIVSAWHGSDIDSVSESGTSMAAPHVAGVAAITLAAYPSFTPQQVRDRIVARAVPNRLSNIGPGSPNLLVNSIYVSDAPTIIHLVCTSAAALIWCSLRWDGGVGPYQIRWTYNGVPRPAWNDSQFPRSTCQLGTNVVIGVRVIGANTLEDRRFIAELCKAIDPM